LCLLSIEARPIENGEHIAFPHDVALIDLEPYDFQPVEITADSRFLSRHNGPVHRQRIDELALLRSDYADGRRDGWRRLIGGPGNGRNARNAIAATIRAANLEFRGFIPVDDIECGRGGRDLAPSSVDAREP